jgi:hypothetical protein
MAEKNTESTAVNALIDLVSTATPLKPDPSDDLMFQEVKPPPAPSRGTAGRTKSMPVAAPAQRVATGTQQGMRTLPAPFSKPAATGPNQTIKAVPPDVRLAASSVSRSMPVAPLTLDHEDEETEVTNPGPAALSRATSQGMPASSAVAVVASRPTRPSLPPPHPTLRSSSPPAIPATPAARPSLSQTLDFSYPVVASNPIAASDPPETLDADDADDEVNQFAAIDDPIASVLEPKMVRPEIPRVSSVWMEQDIGTQQVPKRNDWRTIVGRLVGPMVVLVIVGIFVGGYFAFDGDGGKKRTAAAAAPAPTEARADVAVPGAKPDVKADVASPASAATKVDVAVPAPIDVAKTDVAKTDVAKTDVAKTDVAKTDVAKTDVAKGDVAKADVAKADVAKADVAKADVAKTDVAAKPVVPPNLATAPANAAATTSAPRPASSAAPGARPMLVDIRIDSTPSGATVMLIDRGKSTYLGTTPVRAAVDNARKYELVFSYENRATVVEALDPSKTKAVSVKLGRAASRPATMSSGAAKPKPVAVAKVEKPVVDKPVIEKPKTDKVAAASGGEGTLMISSKPPCEIFVDGKPTGLTTPQRAITLTAGAHKITLVNSAEGIKKTVSVQITADKPTKVIQDLMK